MGEFEIIAPTFLRESNKFDAWLWITSSIVKFSHNHKNPFKINGNYLKNKRDLSQCIQRERSSYSRNGTGTLWKISTKHFRILYISNFHYKIKYLKVVLWFCSWDLCRLCWNFLNFLRLCPRLHQVFNPWTYVVYPLEGFPTRRLVMYENCIYCYDINLNFANFK